ncbi:sensor histidine kinase [Thermodesulfobacteriota bacterium]
MKFRHSLRIRIVVAYCLFGAVQGIVFAAIVYISLDFIDDNLVNQRLTKEVDYLSLQYKYSMKTPETTSPHIKAYFGTKKMPVFAKQITRGLSEGIHEVYHKDVEYHIAVVSLLNHNERLYLLYDVSALEFTEKRKLLIGVVLVTGIFLVIGLGFWIGLMTSRKVIAPVVYLSEQVNQSGPENLPTDLSASFYNDELGVLAQALEKVMQRVEDFIKREQQFSRDASHELRTPVTVIKGAVEVLKQQLGNGEKFNLKPLNRIDNSIKDMENIIETFLWLAREESDLESNQSCSVVSIVRETLEQNQHLFSQKPIQIEFLSEADPILNVSAPALKAVIINLVQNAFHYTTNGKITVTIFHDRVTISDTGRGIASRDLASVVQPHFRGDESKGYGIGLAIVDRLCSKFGWKFEITSKKGEGTTVNLVFISKAELASDKLTR